MRRIDLKSLNKVLINSIRSITDNPMKLKGVDAKQAIREAVEGLNKAYEEESGLKAGEGLNMENIPEHLITKDK